MRKELHSKRLRTVDQRRPILSWAKDAVTNHNNGELFLTETIVSASSTVRRHPKNPYATPRHAKQTKESSTVVVVVVTTMSKQNPNRKTYASTVTCWIDYRRSLANNSHNRTRATHEYRQERQQQQQKQQQ